MGHKIIMKNSHTYKYDTTFNELHNTSNPLEDILMVPVLQAILYQAVSDAIKINLSSREAHEKLAATIWLCDESNPMLQICLSCVNIDHSRILTKVAKEGWNLDL
jgi:hypothetical protein